MTPPTPPATPVPPPLAEPVAQQQTAIAAEAASAAAVTVQQNGMEHRVFMALLLVVTVAFGWILWPFYEAVFWGAIIALLFAPLQRRLLPRLGGRRNLAALLTLLVVLVIVILPLAFVTASLVQETVSVYQRVQSGDISFVRYFQRMLTSLPPWAGQIMHRSGIDNLGALQTKFSAALAQGSQAAAAQVINVGQNTFQFVVSFGVMLYLVFFFLRDGAMLSRYIKDAIPLAPDHKRNLLSKFTTVIRATVKGNIVVAIVQGALGGIAFWFLDIHGALLWAVLMAFLSLLPAIGAGLVWVPVAVYFLVTGAVWQGIGLTAYCVLVIGLVDNALRPVLVGKDTKMPDYVVLISTLGGMALFGLSGFVIGPVIAAMFIAAWDIFVRHPEMQE
jgi:predicted PurR-regulated permease PerM